MARKKEETRSRILNAALDAFEAKGYAASTMEEIAERAGVAKGTLYNYFDGKEALLSGLAEEFAQAVHGQLKRFAVEKSQPLRERILTVYEPLLDHGYETPRTLRAMRVIWGEGLRNPKITEPICRKFLLPVLEPNGLLSKFIEGEDIPEFLKKYPMALAAPIIQGVVLTTIAGNAVKVDLRAYLEAYLDFVLKAR